MTLIVFLLILSLLVLIHELGHFVAARRFGVKVLEFGFGLPPKLFSRFKGETEYTFNLLPFGGFVKLHGEENLQGSDDPRSFAAKSAPKRAVILVAGVFMNLLLAIVLYYGFFLINNFKSLTIPLFFEHEFRFGDKEVLNTVVTAFMEDSAAEKAGIERGETIIEVDNVPVYNNSDIRREIQNKAGKEIKILLLDVRDPDRTLRTIKVTPSKNEDGTGLLGVMLSKAVTLDYSRGSNKIFAAPMHAYNVFGYSMSTFGKLISSSVENKSLEPVSAGVSGPVGIYSAVGGILDYRGKTALLGIIDLAALLSISLAMLNIMPFPALDGGRLLFVIIEMARGGKKVSPKFEATVHKWGMMFLFALIILVTFKDFKTIILG